MMNRTFGRSAAQAVAAQASKMHDTISLEVVFISYQWVVAQWVGFVKGLRNALDDQAAKSERVPPPGMSRGARKCPLNR